MVGGSARLAWVGAGLARRSNPGQVRRRLRWWTARQAAASGGRGSRAEKCFSLLFWLPESV
ncbi:hypothetical protein HPP92_021182 [Vanilla planifolia]|uniref:Uncharacterized protein n=1 Tax=Vanilla planifolia TaxID=51239 RepID=A0A835UHB4_VANPL|nr:hypothetical protein HPP92_021182 [Vanilla planifolia]